MYNFLNAKDDHLRMAELPTHPPILLFESDCYCVCGVRTSMCMLCAYCPYTIRNNIFISQQQQHKKKLLKIGIPNRRRQTVAYSMPTILL